VPGREKWTRENWGKKKGTTGKGDSGMAMGAQTVVMWECKEGGRENLVKKKKNKLGEEWDRDKTIIVPKVVKQK